jgi:hypothetical protein
MSISRTALAVVAALSYAAVAAPVSAATVTYDWTLSSTSTPAQGGFTYTGSGTLVATVGSTDDTITSLTGTLDGQSVTLAPTGTAYGSPSVSSEVSNNLLYPSGGNSTSLIEGHGFAVLNASNALLFGRSSFFPGGAPISGNGYDEIPPPNGSSVGVGQFTITPVPLPASVWMMIAGLGGLGFLVRRMSKQDVGGSGPLAA